MIGVLVLVVGIVHTGLFFVPALVVLAVGTVNRSLDSAAPLKPLPEPVHLEQHRVRRHPPVSGMVNEYRRVV